MKISFNKISIFKNKDLNNDENNLTQYNENTIYEKSDINDCRISSNNINNTKLRRRRGAIYSNNITNTTDNEEDIDNLSNTERLGNRISRECFKRAKSNFKEYTHEKKVSKKYYTLLIAMFILGGLSLYMALKSNNIFNTEDYEVYKSIDNTNDELISNSDESSQSLNEENIVVQTSATAEVENNSSVNKKESKSSTTNNVKVVPLSFSPPLDGQVQKPFSMDKIIYSKTLELWKTHDGIDIKAEIGTNVKSIEKGVVEKVYKDSFYGMSVVIDHSQGYKSVYANLDESVKVKEGQSITKGKVIGKVSNSAIGEIKDDPHLHFMLYKNNEITDPTYILGL